jgi:hypothetical protein
MRKFKKFKVVLAATVMTAMVLTGCGASFDISGSDLENYADKNDSFEFYDDSSIYEDEDYIDGVYVIESDETHVELWDLSSTSRAQSWFDDEVESLTGINGASYSGSETSSGGDYTIKDSEVVYRLLFSNDKFIYSYSDSKETLTEVLEGIGVIEEK